MNGTSTSRMKGQLAVAFLKAVARLPFEKAQNLGRWMGRRRLLFGSGRKVAATNLALCFPQLPLPQRERLVDQALAETGALIAEAGAIWLWPKQRTRELIREVHGLPALQQAQQKNNGVLLMTPHLGNWEMLFPCLANQFEMAAMYRPAKLTQLDNIIKRSRQACGGDMLPTKAAGIKAMLSALRQNKCLILLPDHVPAKGSGVFAPFYGQPAYTINLPFRLWQKTGAEVVFAACLRRADGTGFDVHLTHPPLPKEPMSAKRFATWMNSNLEKLIDLAPAQYQWTYKRFKRQPEGMARPY